MKTPMPGRWTLLSFVLGLALIVALSPSAKAEETTAVLTAIGQAETNAAKAVAKGDLATAKGWSEVAFQLRAGQYLAPFGALTSQFAGQLANFKTFVASATEVENLKPLTDWWSASSRYNSESLNAVMVDNDPAAFKLAITRQAAWEVLRNAHRTLEEEIPYGKERDAAAPKSSDFLALMNWLEAGATSATVPGSELMTKVISTQEVQVGLEPFRKLLTPAKEVAGK